MRLWKSKENHVLGHVLLQLGFVSQEQVDEALGRQAAGDHRPFGVILVELGHVTAEQVEQALFLQKVRRGEVAKEDGLRLIDRAVHGSKRAAASIDELTVAAEELAAKAKG